MPEATKTSRMPRTYFVLAPREMSDKRVKELIRELLQKSKGGKVVFGITEEDYILGHENQPQFRTLGPNLVKSLAAQAPDHLQVLTYSQKDGVDIINKTAFTHAIVINGSFARSFHLRDESKAILAKGARIKHMSPFLDEEEARSYANNFAQASASSASTEALQGEVSGGDRGQHALFCAEVGACERKMLDKEFRKSFDNSFQTAAIIVKDGKIIAKANNTVVPYATYAWHHGPERERHKCDAGDSSHYDTCHAETAALINAGPAARGADLYCRTFPCPQCARNIAYAGIKSVFYQLDFGDPYGYNLFKEAGIEYQKMEDL